MNFDGVFGDVHIRLDTEQNCFSILQTNHVLQENSQAIGLSLVHVGMSSTTEEEN